VAMTKSIHRRNWFNEVSEEKASQIARRLFVSANAARFAVGGQPPGSFVARYRCLILKLRELSGKFEYVSGQWKSVVSPNAQCAFIFLLQSLKVLAHLLKMSGDGSDLVLPQPRRRERES
jgi:hypothetical protein